MKKTKRKIFPEKALGKDELLARMNAAREHDLQWKAGKSFCLIYYPGDERAQLIREAYNLFFTENALNPMSFPSLRKFEAEVVSMVADLLHGGDEATGIFTSGGTESILMAVKTARDYMRDVKPGINKPEIVLPVTAHPAFEKACHYFDVVPVLVPVNEGYKASPEEMRKAIGPNTIMLVASAPSYPHGVIDPVQDIAAIAQEKGLLMHVDACIGGFMLPFMKKLHYPVPDFDFLVPGVTSISVDLHKYGYCAKGASVVLYRNSTLRKYQFFVSTSWPGGIYGSSSVAGSRPGGAIAAAWAALMGIGEEGYREMTAITMDTTARIKRAVQQIPELRLMGEPEMSILAFDSPVLDVYELADELNAAGWHFERLQNPPGLHLTINQIHAASADKFIEDLRKAVGKASKPKLSNIGKSIRIAAVKRLVRILPQGTLAKIQSQFSGKAIGHVRTAPMYGMMGALKGSEDLDQIVLDLLDKLNSEQ